MTETTTLLRGWRRYAARMSASEADEAEANREAYEEEVGITGLPIGELRVRYLEGLQENAGASDSVMDALLSCLPASEDFDGFVTMLEDHGDDDLD